MVAFMARYGFTMRRNHAETAERGGVLLMNWGIETLNPETLNPKPLNPETLNPKPLSPETLNPKNPESSSPESGALSPTL